MSRWLTLVAEVDAGRVSVAATRLNAASELRRRLLRLGERDHCSRTAPSWLEQHTNRRGNRDRLELTQSADARLGSHPAIQLRALEYLEDGAKLIIWVNSEHRRGRLLDYGISLCGLSRESGTRWYARMELDAEQCGQGPCGHPVLHCHVGVDPDAEQEPKARVPLPWLYPWDALDWLLATVEPRLEPNTPGIGSPVG